MNAQATAAVKGLPSEAVSILREAATNAGEWRAAMRDPIGFLKAQGVSLPDGYSLELYEAAWDPEKFTVHESELELLESGATRAYLPGARYEIPPQCAAGTRPVRRLETLTTCIKWGISVGPPEWVPDVEGTPRGHWERETQTVCLLEVKTEAWVTRCIPLLEIVKFKRRKE